MPEVGIVASCSQIFLFTTKQTLNFLFFLSRFEMKKDIDTLIAEERAEIISKYDKVSQLSLLSGLVLDKLEGSHHKPVASDLSCSGRIF